MSYNYRCTKDRCRKRVTRRLRLEQYIHDRWKVCPVCSGKLSYDQEPRRRAKKQTCRCDGYRFPHRAGTEPWCSQAKVGPSEEDHKHRHHTLS